MARLTKEEKKVFDPSLLIQNQKWKSDTIKDLMISEGDKGGAPNRETPGWDKGWPPKPTPQPKPTELANFIGPSGYGTTISEDAYWRGLQTIMETTAPGSDEQNKRLDVLWHQFNDQVSNPADRFMNTLRHQYQDQVSKPTDGMKINQKVAMSASDVGQQVLQQRAEESKAGKIDRGSRSYVGEDHQRAREIDGEVYWYDEYKHMPFYQDILKKHGHTEELQQIQNEIQQKQSLKINPKVAMSPADVPLGDGMIYEAKTQMQKNLKQKYDLMLQEGFIDEVEYKKQMDRHFGTKGKK